MPSGTDVQVGFFWPQSKQTWGGRPGQQRTWSHERWQGCLLCAPCLVRLLRLELLKDLERLLLGRETAHLGRFRVFRCLGRPGCGCAVVVGLVVVVGRGEVVDCSIGRFRRTAPSAVRVPPQRRCQFRCPGAQKPSMWHQPRPLSPVCSRPSSPTTPVSTTPPEKLPAGAGTQLEFWCRLRASFKLIHQFTNPPRPQQNELSTTPAL